MKRFYIIGIDDQADRIFSPEVKALIAGHRVFSGGRRHYGLVRDRLPVSHTWIDITVPLDDVFARYATYEEVVVFASGDPLFFGFANTVRSRLPEAEIRIFPCFNSLQTLAHRLVMPYHDMYIVSLTGRPWHEFDRALIEGRTKLGILTDREHTPAAIAGRMLEYGYRDYRMTVGEKLGNLQERIRTFTLTEAVETTFEFPNCLILERLAARHRWFGIPESEFCLLDGRVKMITKMPVRLLSLSLLDLHHRSVFWDIGFCTGSVSVEAKLQFPHLQVIAFERREEGLALIRQNARKFGTPGITAVTGDFTATDLSVYPSPDAVFIGGHGGKMEEILTLIAKYMQADGVVVFNSVSAESLQLFREAAGKCGFYIDKSSRITVDEHNPIEVVRAVWKRSFA